MPSEREKKLHKAILSMTDEQVEQSLEAAMACIPEPSSDTEHVSICGCFACRIMKGEKLTDVDRRKLTLIEFKKSLLLLLIIEGFSAGIDGYCLSANVVKEIEGSEGIISFQRIGGVAPNTEKAICAVLGRALDDFLLSVPSTPDEFCRIFMGKFSEFLVERRLSMSEASPLRRILEGLMKNVGAQVVSETFPEIH